MHDSNFGTRNGQGSGTAIIFLWDGGVPVNACLQYDMG